MRVYFDICALQRPLDDHAQLRVRLEAEAMISLIQLCEEGTLDLVVSAAHEIENAQNPYPDRQAHVADVLALSAHRARTTPDVAKRTANYVASGLKRLDAFHLAAAVEADATFFCTTDDRLLRRGQSLDTNATSVVSPLDLVLQLNLR
ncbi:MAG: nucleic acid-binding protein [Bacteroidota bacterium]